MRRAALAMAVLGASACGFRAGRFEASVADARDDADARVEIDAIVTGDGALDAPPGAWLAGFAYRRALTITRTGTTALADFPVGVALANDALLALHARADGADLVVTSDDALTVLDSELAGYTSATGAVELWVRVPSVAASSTSLYLYYGGPATATNPSGVWPAMYKGVWHLSEPIAATGANDSTIAANNLGQATASAIPGHAAGVAGLARIHDGIDDRLELPDPADGSLDVGLQSFSYSIWVFVTGNVGQYDQPFYKGGTSQGNPGYCMMLGTGSWSAKLHDGTSGSSFVNSEYSPTPLLNQWLHLVTVVDRSTSPATIASYVNGARTDLFDLTLGSFDTTQPFMIGGGSGGSRFQGTTDEARIYSTALTAEWIATEYANLATPGFVTLGAEQTP